MNYQNLYNILIEKSKNRTPTDNYMEEHHIVPLSMGGTDIATNLVKLTAKEHYVAHHLLYKIYRNREMTMAFMLMVNVERGGQKFKITASTYHKLKEDNSKVRSIAMTGGVSPNKGKKWSEESKAKLSASTKGRTGGNYNTPGFQGKTHTGENKKKLSEKQKGNKNHLGIQHSDETKRMMSENRKGKTKVPWTEERKAARRKLLAEKFSQEKSPD
jgi:hypothetical protein